MTYRNTSSEFFTVNECAEYLNITNRHARHLFDVRAFQVVKVGRLVRVRRADLDAYLAQNICGVRL